MANEPPPVVPGPPSGPPRGAPPDVTVTWGAVPRSGATAQPLGTHPQAAGPPIPIPKPGDVGGDDTAHRNRRILQISLIAGGAVLAVGLIVVIAMVMSGAGNSRGDLTGFSAEPSDYLPTEVDGRAVHTNAPVLDEVSKRFLAAHGLEGANFELAAALLPSGPRQPPQVVLLVAGGSGAEGLMDSFQGDQKVRADDQIELEGQDVRLVRVDNEEFPEVWTAIASPREDIAVVAISFSGGRDGAASMMSAALETGRQ